MIWVSFSFGHTLGRLAGDLPGKGPWRPANEGVGNGLFFRPGFVGKRGFVDGFLRWSVVSWGREKFASEDPVMDRCKDSSRNHGISNISIIFPGHYCFS
jgi:hypothetical protein